MSKIKRSQVKTFLNTGTPAAPTWVLIGDGVVNAKINYNPKILTETYISEESANISVESYSPTIPIEMTALNSDAAFEYIDALRIARSVMGDIETEIVNVWLYEDSALGYYPAEKQKISIQADDFGGEGGTAIKMNYTINFIDDPVAGTFNPTPTAAFVADPILASLSSLSVGGHALTPVFDTDWLWYELAVSTSTDTITAVANNDGDIAIDEDGTPVANGADATWEEGLNVLTVEVTVGSEVVEYIVNVTYTA